MYIFGGASLLDTWKRNISNEQFSVGYIIKTNRNKITINSRGMIHVGTKYEKYSSNVHVNLSIYITGK